MNTLNRHIVRCTAAALFAAAGASSGLAQSIPADGFDDRPVITGLPEVLGIQFHPSGWGLIWAKNGTVYRYDAGQPVGSPLLDLHEEVGDWDDYGLLCVAFDPQFDTNGRIYLCYEVDWYWYTMYGQPGYDPNGDSYFRATFGRVTRYTLDKTTGFTTVVPNSRKILVGETASAGFPIFSTTHGVGTLLFGQDGTLLVGCGEGAQYSAADGGGSISYAPEGIADGIIQPIDDVGAFRTQTVQTISGKILRIDPDTGDGIPSNPFYDPANPHSAKSRVWAMGVRNPYRITLKPNSGDHDPSVGKPGTLYFGDVGWNTREELDVCTAGGQNFGWPLYEGLDFRPEYAAVDPTNPYSPNPTASGTCPPFYRYQDLLVNASPNTPAWPDPCNTGQQVASSAYRFVHRRPIMDWNGNSEVRVPRFDNNGNPIAVSLADAGIPGGTFGGATSTGGIFYDAANYAATPYPPQFFNTYFHADFTGGWIRNIITDANDQVVSTYSMLINAGGIVWVTINPADGNIYFVTYSYTGDATIRKLVYGGNHAPVATAGSTTPLYGPSPLNVQFSSAGTYDVDNDALTYQWNFGDGSPIDTTPNPSHVFTSTGPHRFDVTLTVTDTHGESSVSNLVVTPNNTPPQVQITHPINGMLYRPQAGNFQLPLSASVSDAEQSASSLTYAWQLILHHNAHTHPGAPINTIAPTVTVEPLGCDGPTYYYEILLRVTDSVGLTTSASSFIYPACCYANCDGSTTSPVLSGNDFTCFLAQFRAAEQYANCDGSTVPPMLNASDFVCFLGKFRAGCP
jgi:glucose/arabinose dehydrogenase